MAILLREDGTSQNIVPKNGNDFKLKELYEMLNCELIEVVQTNSAGIIMIIDEEGKLKNLPINIEASRLSKIGDDYIVGNAVVCSEFMFK